MKTEIIKCLQDNYSYIIIDESNNNACVVDPGESFPIIDFPEPIRPIKQIFFFLISLKLNISWLFLIIDKFLLKLKKT